MLCTSVRSTSVKAMVPVSVRLPTGVTSSVTAPVTSVAATIGASLVPVMVTVMVRDTLPPLPSSTLKREGLDLGLARRQILDGRGRHAVVPGDHATQAAARGVGGHARRQAAQRPGRSA